MTRVDAASYIADMSAELKKIATSHKLNVEAYLLDMVSLSARGSALGGAAVVPKIEPIESEGTSRDVMALVIHDDMQASAG